MLDIFGDGRKRPKLSVNVKIKINTKYKEESLKWNKVFGYIMKKPRTKLEFLMVNSIRRLQLSNITLEKIEPYISEEDYSQLSEIENTFNTQLPDDLKAFILAILKVPTPALESM